MEANCDLVDGLEMSFFAYFPRWETEKCRKYGMVNTEMLVDKLSRKVPGSVVISSYLYEGGIGNAIQDMMNINAAINKNYELGIQDERWHNIRIYFRRESEIQIKRF